MRLRSTLYAGTVTHRSVRPRPHRLRYRVFWMLLDLDEIDRLPRRLRLFSHNRFNALSFFDADHGDGSGRLLRDQVEGHLRAAGLAPDGGAIRLFCMPRIFGYGFNPLSVYFCYQRDGSLAAILYEVHNTFRERHSYLIPVDRDAGVAGAPGAVIEQHCRKGFYVSPFMDMDMSYAFRVAVPDQRVMVAIRAADNDGLLLAAALTRRADRADRPGAAARACHPSAAHPQGHWRHSLACAANGAERIPVAAAARVRPPTRSPS